MTAADTSVVVAAFARWHDQHARAREALAESTVLIGHVAFEAYSVLTRMPAPRRAAPELVTAFLEHHFPAPPATLSGPECASLLRDAPGRGITGGAVYDAVVAATAQCAGALLVTLDRRAVPVYRALGAAHRLVA